MRQAFESLGQLKTQTGWLFAVISTSIFGGLIPTVLPIVLRLPQGSVSQDKFWTFLAANCLFWAFKGLEVDLLYQFQSWMFGDNNDFKTVATKVFIDMTFYAPAIGLLNCILFYAWRDNQFSISRTRKSLGEHWYINKVLPPLISNFCVWCPAAVLIYNLPLPLQLPIQNLILCFWVLILVFFTSESEQ